MTPVVWALFGLVCTGHTNAQCKPYIVAYPSREACVAAITDSTKLCVPLAGMPVMKGQN